MKITKQQLREMIEDEIGQQSVLNSFQRAYDNGDIGDDDIADLGQMRDVLQGFVDLGIDQTFSTAAGQLIPLLSAIVNVNTD